MNYKEPEQKWREKTVLEVAEVAEVAEIVGMSLKGTYRALQKGAIPSVRIGNAIKIPTRALAKMLDGEDIDANRRSK